MNLSVNAVAFTCSMHTSHEPVVWKVCVCVPSILLYQTHKSSRRASFKQGDDSSVNGLIRDMSNLMSKFGKVKARHLINPVDHCYKIVCK